jgi:hypothetical protein
MTGLFVKILSYSHLLKALRVAIVAGMLVAVVCAPSLVAASDVDGFGP